MGYTLGPSWRRLTWTSHLWRHILATYLNLSFTRRNVDQVHRSPCLWRSLMLNVMPARNSIELDVETARERAVFSLAGYHAGGEWDTDLRKRMQSSITSAWPLLINFVFIVCSKLPTTTDNERLHVEWQYILLAKFLVIVRPPFTLSVNESLARCGCSSLLSTNMKMIRILYFSALASATTSAREATWPSSLLSCL